MSNAQNAHYVELRNKAIHEGDLMAKSFADSQRAFKSGDGSSAHDLSLQGKEHQRLKDLYNDQAASWIFQENNKIQPRGSIDLHGLYVQESIEFTERCIDESRQQGLQELRVIVGKGNHSPSHVAKLKPAITSLMKRKHLTAYLDPNNQGVLIVQLQQQGNSREMITEGDQLVRSIGQKEDGGCVVM
jgi:DNA-nicking Smr family endonuclease